MYTYMYRERDIHTHYINSNTYIYIYKYKSVCVIGTPATWSARAYFGAWVGVHVKIL